MRNLLHKTRETARIEKLLREFFPDFPADYPPEAYRYNPVCIRLRVVSPSFSGKDRVSRFDMVSDMLEKHLAKETWSDLSLLVLLAPEDIEDSLANQEFENPTAPPRLASSRSAAMSRNGQKTGRKPAKTKRKST